MRISSLQKFIITSTLSFATIAVLLFLLTMVSHNVQNYRDTLTTTVNNIAADEKDFDRLTKISDVLKNRDSDIQRLGSIAVNRQRPLKFIETIEQMGHLTNTKISLGINETRGSMDFIFFGITIEGNKVNVRTMLALIQALPYQIAIENMSFQQGTAGTQNYGESSSQSMTRLILTMRVKTQQ